MMLKLKKSKLKINLPDGWHEVSFNLGLKIVSQKINDPLKLMSLFTKYSEEKLKQSTDLETIYLMMDTLLFLKQDPIKNLPEFPYKVLDIDLPWVSYHDSFDLGGCSVGQVEDMKAYIQNNLPKDSKDVDVLEISLALVAIYLDPYLNKSDYDYNRAIKSISSLGDKLDYKTVINMGGFFFEKLKGLTVGQVRGLKRRDTIRRKLTLVFRNLLQRLVSILR